MPSDTERLRYLMNCVEGIASIPLDRHDFAMTVAEHRGHDEPTPADELDGFRQLIDAAMIKDAAATDYAALDAAILEHLRWWNKHPKHAKACREAALQIDPLNRERAITARLQALRKAGKISYNRHIGWSLANDGS